MFIKQEFVENRLNYNWDALNSHIALMLFTEVQFDWMPWNLRANHIRTGKIRQRVDDSKRIGDLDSR